MPTSATISKLTACMENIFRESPEARKALREWLDELDREQAAIAPPSIGTPPHGDRKSSAARSPSPERDPSGVYFGNKRAYYSVDPEDYRWSLIKVVNGTHAIYARQFKFGEVTLRYYFTTGTVQLVYSMEKYPYYVDDKGDYKASYYDSDEDEYIQIPRKVVENFRGLDESEFRKLVHNAPVMFGKGYRA